MTAAVAGVLFYLSLGVAGILGAGRLTALLAILGSWVSLALWAPAFSTAVVGGAPWGIPLVGDTLALAFWCVAPLVHAVVWWHERHRSTTFHGLVTLLVGTCLAAVLSRDVFNLYVLLDLGSLLSVVLVAFDRSSRAVWAGLRYLLLSALGMLVYLLGVGLVYSELGTLSLVQITELAPGLSHPPLAVGVSLLVMGALVKAGVFLFGLWLPPAHGHAPTGVSVILSSVVVKMGVVALFRLSEAFSVGPVLVGIGLLTGVGGMIYALWESDLKVFLAFSTVSQLGYMLIGFGVGGAAAFGATLFLVAHGLYKGLLFLSAGAAIEEQGERTFERLAGNLSWGVALGLGLGGLAIVGVPPLAGFVAKGALSAGLPSMAKVALVGLSVGTAAAFFRVLPLVRSRGPKRGAKAGAAGLILALGTFGVWGFFFVPAVLDPWEWAIAGGTLAVGYGVHRALRGISFRLPRLKLHGGMVAVLLGVVALGAGILLLG